MVQQLPPGETAQDLSEETYEGQRDPTWGRGRVLALGSARGKTS